ncbi:hypothetical protein O4H49_08015 [Kiloniella laminariae]|uniref:Solute-binding protein family 3/N-terminal domain-containing protein n=1 Tax=Kiloniella laminariae TaxID=454162 RepID=A0ABT4LHY0_9PROT|nr:hypothetical protein [Kiloniella laminariae]MCZ4280720.1 hypothetical protein [Kiloniella laminariae]
MLFGRMIFGGLFFAIILFPCFAAQAVEPTVFTSRGPETALDRRYEYQHQLLELALEKTIAEFGPYRLERSKIGANTKRAMIEVEKGSYQNFFVANAVTVERMQEMVAVPFPIDLGILGYRVFFASEQTCERLRQVTTLEQLKKFTMVQGIGWGDTKILKQAGFRVTEASDYHGMFQMVANNRADLFPRGINEFLREWEVNREVENLSYDTQLILYYPFPKFFYTAKGNEAQAQRIMTGLIAAYDDGSLLKLWQSEYQASIDRINLSSRRILSVENPELDRIDPAYKKYFYLPSQVLTQ